MLRCASVVYCAGSMTPQAIFQANAVNSITVCCAEMDNIKRSQHAILKTLKTNLFKVPANLKGLVLP